MFYKVCRITNMALSSLYLLFLLIGILRTEEFSIELLFFLIGFSITGVVFIWFDVMCGKIDKFNKDQAAITIQVKKAGKILFIFNLLCALAVLFCSIALIFSFADERISNKSTVNYIYLTFILIFILGSFTAIANLFFYRKSLKENTNMTTAVIDEIGVY